MLVHKNKSYKYQELAVGEVVLIGDDYTKTIRRPLGVIVEMFVVIDGTVSKWQK